VGGMLDKLRMRVNELWRRSEEDDTYVVDIGALPNSGTKNVDHGIPDFDKTKVIQFWGVAISPTYTIPLPHSTGALASQVTIDFSGTQLQVITYQSMNMYTGKIYIKYRK
jgi:hypothetical protein